MGKEMGYRVILLVLFFSAPVSAIVEIVGVRPGGETWRFVRLAHALQKRTSLALATMLHVRDGSNFASAPWLWVRDLSFVRDSVALSQWLRKGGMLVVEGTEVEALLAFTARTFGTNTGRWQNIPLDHELMRSFYLLDALPVCRNQPWRGFTFAGRLAIVMIPHRLLVYLRDKSVAVPCLAKVGREMTTRIFVNLLMVALAGDYKKDQVHLPEILKRLR